MNRYEDQFSANDYHGLSREKQSYEIKRGENHVLLSAPHTVKHMRQGVIKLQEINTGNLVLDLAYETKCHAIYKTSTDDEDPNFSDISPYRNEMFQYIMSEDIQFVLDIHGKKDDHVDIIIGTNHLANIGLNRNFYRFMTSFWKSSLFRVRFDYRFAASKTNNISKTMYDLTKTYALQFEISRTLRTDHVYYEIFKSQMIQFIHALEKMTVFPVKNMSVLKPAYPPKMVGISNQRKHHSLQDNGFINVGHSPLYTTNTMKIVVDAFDKTRINYMKKSTLEDKSVVFTVVDQIKVSNFFKQKYEYLDLDVIGLDDDTFYEIYKHKTDYVCIYNPMTHAMMTVKCQPVEKKKNPSLWISYKYRELLGLIPQISYTMSEYNALIDLMKMKNEDALLAFFNHGYERNDMVGMYYLKDDLSFETIEALKTIDKEMIRKRFIKLVDVYVMPSDPLKPPRKHILDRLVGYSSTKLNVENARSVDEGSHTVRISTYMAKKLDILENDRLVLYSIKKRISCRVIIDPHVSNYYILVPQNVKFELDLFKGRVIYVKRDSIFLVLKSFDRLLLTLFLSYFSIYSAVNLMKISSIYLNIAIFVVVFFLIIISSFSERRFNVK